MVYGILLLRSIGEGERYKSKRGREDFAGPNPASAIVGITADNGTMLDSQATVRVGDESAMSRTRPLDFPSNPRARCGPVAELADSKVVGEATQS
jgi:hypothetical protein